MEKGKFFDFTRTASILLAVTILVTAGCATLPTADDDAAIRAVFEDGAEAWNRGSIDGYLDGYQKTETLRWASGGMVVYGWEGVERAFKMRFDSPEKMGQLSASDLEISSPTRRDAIVFGKWTQVLEDQTRTGFFTVHMKKTDGVWQIISDHSSSAD